MTATPFTLPRTEVVPLRSDEGDAYQLALAWPDGDPPAGGWPVLYLLDATGSFATCVEAVRRMGRRPAATGVCPLVIAGLSAATGYDVARRQRDYTTPRAVAAAPEEGGAAQFLRFIEDDVKATVASRGPVDARRQTLCGHSLAGYFALWALTERPGAFRAYAAISPSVWWDKARILAGAERLDPGAAELLLTIGEWEGDLPPWQQNAPDAESVKARRAARNMIAGTREVAACFAASLGEQAVRFAVLPEEDHASIISTAIPRVLRLASG